MIRDIDQRLLITALVVRTAKLQIIITKCICDSECGEIERKMQNLHTVIDHWKKACLSILFLYY
jgi:hypothetical protein